MSSSFLFFRPFILSWLPILLSLGAIALFGLGNPPRLLHTDRATPGSDLTVQGVHSPSSLDRTAQFHEQIIMLTGLEALSRVGTEESADILTRPGGKKGSMAIHSAGI